MKLTSQFILCVIAPTWIVSLVMLCVTFATPIVLQPMSLSRTWIANSRNSRMLTLTDSKAQKIDISFRQTEKSLNLAHSYAQKWIRGLLPISQPYTTYFWNSAVTPQVDAAGFPLSSVGYSNNTNIDASTQYVNDSSILDNVFRAIFKSSNMSTQMFMGFANGFHRAYPYSRLPGYKTLQYNCSSTGQPVVGYTPQCRSWYAPAAGTDTIQYTAPFVSTSGALHITTSKRVMNYSNLVGVLGIDINMTIIDNLVVGGATSLSYDLLLDTSGQVISHPGLDRALPSQSIVQLEASIPAVQWTAITSVRSTTPTLFDIKKNGASWYAVAEYLPSSRYILVALYSDSLNEDLTVQWFVNGSASSLSGIIAVIILAAVVLIVATGLAICQTNQASSSIDHLTATLKNISRPNYIGITQATAFSQELTEINKTFGHLLIASKAGEKAFLKGDLHEALQLFTDALAMFTEYRNPRGLSYCHNNLGCVLKELKRYEAALQEFTLAMSIVVDQIGMYNHAPAVQGGWKNTLSHIKMNVGNLYKDTGDFASAERLYREALDLAGDDAEGIAEISGNLGQLYIQTGRFTLARASIENAYMIIKDRGEPMAIQQAMLNVALMEAAAGNNDEALKWYGHIVLNNSRLNPYVKQTCYNNIHEILTQQGRFDEARLLDTHIDETYTKCDIFFVLDCSGSMQLPSLDTGIPRIQTCRQNIFEIISRDLHADDNVSMIIFNSENTTLFESKNKRLDLALMESCIRDRTPASGGTAFYDGLYKALQRIKTTSNPIKWAVVLTDGEDQHSSEHSPTDLKQLMSSGPVVNLIIIAAGKLDTEIRVEGRKTTCIAVLGNLVDAAKKTGKGMLITSGTGTAEITSAFRRAVEIMKGRMRVMNF